MVDIWDRAVGAKEPGGCVCHLGPHVGAMGLSGPREVTGKPRPHVSGTMVACV
jgi:hypothetical protein